MKSDRRQRKDCNPRRLQTLLKAIRVDILELSTREMAEKLNEETRTRDGSRVIDFTENIVKNLEDSSTSYRYIHLECYANVLKLPVGVLLLVSRFQHSSPAEVKRVIEALVAVLISKEREMISYEHLTRLADKIDFIRFHDLRRDNNNDYLEDRSTIERLKLHKKTHEEKGYSIDESLPLFRKYNTNY